MSRLFDYFVVPVKQNITKYLVQWKKWICFMHLLRNENTYLLLLSWLVISLKHISICLTSNYFKKPRVSSLFWLTWSKCMGSKLPWSTQQASPILECMELICEVLLGHFWPVYLLHVSKNDDEKRCFLK